MEIIVSKGYYPIDIEAAEKKYNAKYIGDFCIALKDGGWSEKPYAIFYTENPDRSKGHTNYFSLSVTYKEIDGKLEVDKMYIGKGDHAFTQPFVGLLTKNGNVLISCYRHHFNQEGSEFIDGGRDYQKHSIPAKFVSVEIDEDKLKVINND